MSLAVVESSLRGSSLEQGNTTTDDGLAVMDDLPKDCIEAIISHTSPWDACRLACLNRTFADVVRSDTLWGNLLPSDYARVYPQATALGSNREIVETLARGIPLDHGLERYLLLRRSGGVCRLLSVAAMTIAWGDDSRFWRWDFSRSSCFSRVAHLLAVCWLDVSGTWRCTLPPGTYSVVWRLKVANPQGGRFRFLSWKKPLRFVVTTAHDQVLEKDLDLGQVHINVFEEWFEFEVGQIVVHGLGREAKQLDVVYSIEEHDCSYWKGGLLLDCLALRPSSAQNELVYIKHPAVQTEKLRVRPGVF
ncbi:hypothetical protein R1sor_001804 [Riccia sorocarpa]|uniref:F-box domain-containing protein n=1 Tax=Riccia sorocarpa TaxID=122646 RepID=A0ABD3H043_9MARC